MKRIIQIMLVIMACVIPSSLSAASAQAATPTPLTSTQETTLKAILLRANPQLSTTQLTQLVQNPDFVKAAGTVVAVDITPIRVSTVQPALSSLVSTTATTYCKYAWSQVKGRGLFGTLFSFKVQLNWCYDNNRVYYQSYRVTPDLTTYGSTLGWSYRGEWQSRNVHYYTWNGHYRGGYVAEAFGEFARCLGGNIGCIDQRFADVGVFGHYNGTYTARHNLN